MTHQREYALELKNITKSFATVRVLTDVSLSLRRGTILGLVGENGAGKSTMMNILGGVLKRDAGEILLDGSPFEPKGPKGAKAAGIAFVHQELNLFSNLSVAENLYITGLPKLGKTGLVNLVRTKRDAKGKLAELGIDNIPPDALIGDLPMGQRQLIEIAKAMISDAEIIIMDEPTTSLSTKEKTNLFRIMHEQIEKGKSIIFISHILEDVFAHSDEIAVLRDGKLIAQKPAAELTRAEVVKMMVGRELSKIYPTVEKSIGEVLFQARDICREGRFKNINLTLRQGEIVGLFGLMGAGRTELLKCLFGVDPVSGGEVLIDGKALERLTPQGCIESGMAFITENRREEGLLITKTVRENTVMASLDELGKRMFGVLDFKKEQAMSDEMVEALKVRTYDANRQVVVSLSGGNQQKVVLSKWVVKKPRVFLLDEPTRGVDVGAKYEIYSIIGDLTRENSAVLMVSSEMEELMGMCDRILVMYNNAITAEFHKGAFDQEKIIVAAIGGQNHEQ